MRKVWLYVGVGGIVVSVLVMALFNAFGGRGSSDVIEQVSVNVPEGVAVPVSDSKAEAYMNSRVSTELYFAQLSAEEDIFLVSSDGNDVEQKQLVVIEDEGAAAKRVFGDSNVSVAGTAVERSQVKPGMTGGNGYAQLTQDQRLEYDRRRAEMVRDMMTGNEIAGQVGNDVLILLYL